MFTTVLPILFINQTPSNWTLSRLNHIRFLRVEHFKKIYGPFLLRDAMRKRGLCSSGVCLSVRLSSVRVFVTLVDCVHTAEDIVKLLLRPGSRIILVFFDLQRRYPIPRGTPSTMALNTRGWEKSAIFYWNSRLSRKQYEIGPWLLRNVNRKSYGGGSIHVDSDDLEWHLTLVSRYTCILTSRIS